MPGPTRWCRWMHPVCGHEGLACLAWWRLWRGYNSTAHYRHSYSVLTASHPAPGLMFPLLSLLCAAPCAGHLHPPPVLPVPPARARGAGAAGRRAGGRCESIARVVLLDAYCCVGLRRGRSAGLRRTCSCSTAAVLQHHWFQKRLPPSHLSLSQSGPSTTPQWPPRRLPGSAPAARWWCAACTTCPLRWHSWSSCAARPVSRGCGAQILDCAHCDCSGPTALLLWCDCPCLFIPEVALFHSPPVSPGLSGLSPGTLHVVLTGEGEAALVLSEAAHQILRQQNVDGYAPSGVFQTCCVWHAARWLHVLLSACTWAPPTLSITSFLSILPQPHRLRGPAPAVCGPQDSCRLRRRPSARHRRPAGGSRLCGGQRDEQAGQAGAPAHRVLPGAG